MHIKKLKVRPRKEHAKAVCGVQLASMLGCWAASGDTHSVGPCQESAKALYECMRTAPLGGKQHGSTINYHLMRLGKILNK
ncbi:hypothetical protein IEO21_02443 [Rhodonia placenta]|uniref:CHCH domain-containing protein n=2 Tax=Rhodonia placenta TaxID=104341 RepID=A0A1X6N903_9APHY|nr:hypothetical protein POSPLADRAFT_1136515 [Postia placenta MAD-698-R-SB12]KAF9818905.1 hypothetical protein IEO21_02443 [Postia placenta]OSX64992.1 hypothetical protein POSPLADRAFT_1136515 [Postia placenta MAD-698-R-SB12]